MLQALNLLEPLDLRGMGYDSARYIHTVYQAMNLAFADRDFYYGDPYLPPEEPIRGLLSKAYAQDRWRTFNLHRNDPDVRPGDPYPYEGGVNPFLGFLTNWSNLRTNRQAAPGPSATPVPPAGTASLQDLDEEFRMGTTSIQAADEHGWAISVTPSGGWLPACVAGRTGVALSQRMQSFVLEEAENPFNVVRPGQRPRVTLTPTLALKEGKPWLCFSVQGGDTQDQNLLQFLLNVVDFGMTVQEACEAANFTSYQMRSSFGRHEVQPGRLTLSEKVPDWVRDELRSMGYVLDFQRRTSGPITAIWFDQEHGTLWGGASDHGDDYGIAW
jgi:gamma-glutamyltranspeptidase/glutathione hydrolase